MFREFWHGRLGRPFRLSFSVWGNGPHVVLLLHGITSDGSFWQPLIDILPAEQYTLIVPDLLGHGGSPRPQFAKYSTGDQARAVLALLRRLKVRDCVVVGHSMGGLVASRLAVLAPQRVSRLLLYEPPIYGDVPEFKTHARRRRFYFNIYKRIAANPPGRLTMARLVARISSTWTQFLASDQLWLPIERSLRNTILTQTSYEELRGTAIQTDIVHGRLDVAVSGSGLKKLLADNPNIRFYKTTERHGLSKRSARYLAQLLAVEAMLPGQREQ